MPTAACRSRLRDRANISAWRRRGDWAWWFKDSVVVPAKAGTHNHWPWLSTRAVDCAALSMDFAVWARIGARYCLLVRDDESWILDSIFKQPRGHCDPLAPHNDG